MRSSTLRMVALAALGCCAAFSMAQVWDVALDFSASANPTRDWTYGQANKADLSGFRAYDRTFDLLGMNGWSTVADVYNPNVIFNGTSSDITADTITWRAGEFSLIPGPNFDGSLVSLARWTAPATGDYQYTAFFSRLSPRGMATAGVSLTGATPTYALVDASGVSRSGSVYLLAGQTIDFIVASTVSSQDTTGLSAQIQAVPEPASFAALGLGLVATARRRKEAKP